MFNFELKSFVQSQRSHALANRGQLTRDDQNLTFFLSG